MYSYNDSKIKDILDSHINKLSEIERCNLNSNVQLLEGIVTSSGNNPNKVNIKVPSLSTELRDVLVCSSVSASIQAPLASGSIVVILTSTRTPPIVLFVLGKNTSLKSSFVESGDILNTTKSSFQKMTSSGSIVTSNQNGYLNIINGSGEETILSNDTSEFSNNKITFSVSVLGRDIFIEIYPVVTNHNLDSVEDDANSLITSLDKLINEVGSLASLSSETTGSNISKFCNMIYNKFIEAEFLYIQKGAVLSKPILRKKDVENIEISDFVADKVFSVGIVKNGILARNLDA